MTGTLLIAFLMGITGSLHCAGMCGAIMWAMPFYSFTGSRKIVAFALYHFMRITAYVSMALILFSFHQLFRPGIQQLISVTLGVLLLAAGSFSFFSGKLFKEIPLPWSGFVKKQLAAFVGQPQLRKIGVAGLLNGMLPCGLVYMALSACMSLPSRPQVVEFVYAFGAGTVPVLAVIVFLRSRAALRWAGIRRLAPLTVFFFGCLFILRGSGLGIPYLSPRVEMAKGGLVHSCCHKK